MKKKLSEKGDKIIDLGIGTVFKAPEITVKTLKQAAENPSFHHYNFYNGYPFYREVAAHWMKKQHSVELNPETEITATTGSKETLFKIPTAFIDPGDIALIPSPSYPVAATSTASCGGKVFYLPLRVENNVLPDFSEVPTKTKEKIKFVLYI